MTIVWLDYRGTEEKEVTVVKDEDDNEKSFPDLNNREPRIALQEKSVFFFVGQMTLRDINRSIRVV